MLEAPSDSDSVHEIDIKQHLKPVEEQSEEPSSEVWGEGGEDEMYEGGGESEQTEIDFNPQGNDT